MTFDVIRYLKSKNIKYKTSGKNVSRGWVGIQCFNHLDHSNHLGIHLDSGVLSCWHCGKLGNYVRLIKEVEKCSWGHAKKIAKKFQTESVEIEEEVEIIPPDELAWPQEFIKSIPNLHRKYLKKRNFDPEYLTRKYNLFFCKGFSDYSFRIIAPIYMNKRLVSYVGRDVSGTQNIRYLYCDDKNAVVKRKNLIYNLDSVDDVAIFVEGISDVWRIGDGAVGLLSMQFSKSQIYEIKKKQIKKAYILFDKGKKEVEKAEELESYLTFIPEVYHIELPEYAGDPGELRNEDVIKLRRDIF